MATNTLDKGIESLIEVFANAKELEHSFMYTSSVFSEESQAAMQQHWYTSTSFLMTPTSLPTRAKCN